MKIDVRSENSVYIEIDDYVFYIDNSTNEQIMDCWVKGKEDKLVTRYGFDQLFL
jgi:hypothetical protein